MNIFRKHIHFSPVDPLGDGLREQILAEQQEPQAITLEEVIDDATLQCYWNSINADTSGPFDKKVED